MKTPQNSTTMYTEKTQQKSPSRTIQSKPGAGSVYMEDNRPEAVGQAKMIDTIQKQNESMNRICQQKRDLSKKEANPTLVAKWASTRIRAMMYVDKTVSDWIDCAIKLGIPVMKPEEFGHASGKDKDGSKKANSAYAYLRAACRSAAKVEENYKVSQLHKNGK